MDQGNDLLDPRSGYIKKYRDYLSSQNIPHKNLSDDQILYHYGKQAEAGGHLGEMPTLNKLYNQSRAKIQREQNGMMNLPIQFYEGLKKGGNIAGSMLTGEVSAIGETYNKALQGIDIDCWARFQV